MGEQNNQRGGLTTAALVKTLKSNPMKKLILFLLFYIYKTIEAADLFTTD